MGRTLIDIKKSVPVPGRFHYSREEELLLDFALETLCKEWNNLIEVANDTEVSNAEDRSELVLVYSDDGVRLFHTCEVLDSA